MVWQIVLEAAQELSASHGTFTRANIIDKIHENHPKVFENSIGPYIQSMIKPDYRHPYLEKVAPNQYRLRRETVDIKPEEEEDTVEVLRETRISLERDLESFIVEQIQAVEKGLKLKEPEYRQVSVNSGRIDVLAEDSKGKMVIIELKAGQARDRVLAQILAYMSNITETYSDTETRGIIIAHSFSDQLLQAVKIVPRVKLLRYGIKFEFENPNARIFRASRAREKEG